MQPLDFSYKCLPIYIHSKKNGNADANIIKLIYQIIDILKNDGIIIKNAATDGDDGYSSETEKKHFQFIWMNL